MGVSTTALYVHFPDKDAILQAIAAAAFAELLGILEASQRDCGFAPDQLRAGLRAFVNFGLARPDAYRLTFFSSSIRRAVAINDPGASVNIPSLPQQCFVPPTLT